MVLAILNELLWFQPKTSKCEPIIVYPLLRIVRLVGHRIDRNCLLLRLCFLLLMLRRVPLRIVSPHLSVAGWRVLPTAVPAAIIAAVAVPAPVTPSSVAVASLRTVTVHETDRLQSQIVQNHTKDYTKISIKKKILTIPTFSVMIRFAASTFSGDPRM